MKVVYLNLALCASLLYVTWNRNSRSLHNSCFMFDLSMWKVCIACLLYFLWAIELNWNASLLCSCSLLNFCLIYMLFTSQFSEIQLSSLYTIQSFRASWPPNLIQTVLHTLILMFHRMLAASNTGKMKSKQFIYVFSFINAQSNWLMQITI